LKTTAIADLAWAFTHWASTSEYQCDDSNLPGAPELETPGGLAERCFLVLIGVHRRLSAAHSPDGLCLDRSVYTIRLERDGL